MSDKAQSVGVCKSFIRHLLKNKKEAEIAHKQSPLC